MSRLDEYKNDKSVKRAERYGFELVDAQEQSGDHGVNLVFKQTSGKYRKSEDAKNVLSNAIRRSKSVKEKGGEYWVYVDDYIGEGKQKKTFAQLTEELNEGYGKSRGRPKV